MDYISRIPTESGARPFPRRVAVFGCTGSIGTNTLKVLSAWKSEGRFSITALAAGRNIRLLAEQASEWRPPFLAIRDAQGPSGPDALLRLLPPDYRPEILAGPEGCAFLASHEDVDIVVSAQAAAAGLRATTYAAAAGKTICLANKESLVLAGSLIRRLCARTGAVVLPVDSEHFALFQCMAGRLPSDISRLIITASGGPFRTWEASRLPSVRPEDALKHPNWSMGAKITIDSATLMNKGLEVIEACHLYGIPASLVTVAVHPQSIVHSLVELSDGSVMGQFAVPDMRLPIAGCLAWPSMPSAESAGISRLDLIASGQLTFEAPRRKDFPCLDLACRAYAEGRTVELNAANEVAVARFLGGHIRFTDIPVLVRSALDRASAPLDFSLDGTDIRSSVERILNEIENLDASVRSETAAILPE